MTDEESRYGLSDDQNAQCDKAAELAREALAEPMAAAMKRLLDDAHEKMYDYLMGEMESDTRYNFAGMVRERSNRIIKGLLSGGWDEKAAREWLEHFDFAEYRRQVYEAHRDIIQN